MEILFYLFAALTMICSILVVANPFSRNAVTSAMFLVLTILSMAGLFVLLDAFFLAAVQVIVYAGAIIVLYLFVIMLLDLREEARRKLNKTAIALSVIGVGALICLLIGSILHPNSIVHFSDASESKPVTEMTAPELSTDRPNVGDTPALGKALFSDYVLPFEVASVILLVAMVGVILLSKKELK